MEKTYFTEGDQPESQMGARARVACAIRSMRVARLALKAIRTASLQATLMTF